MDKKNVTTSKWRSSFFETFKAQCSESDLGPISLNWFEELSSEVPPYDCKISEDAEYKASFLDQHIFKMPKKKLFTNSQLASTPMIFKEQTKILPLFGSPVKEMEQSKTKADRSVSETPATRTILDQSNELISPPSNTCLIASPAVLRNICGTPLGNKFVLNGSLLCTPKIFQAQTPKCISESLGAEADPEMSWSSSLATPPTLSPTVVIATAENAASEEKSHNERLALIMQSLLAKYRRSPGRAEIEDFRSGEDSKSQNFEKLLDGCLGIDTLPNKSNVSQKLPNSLEDRMIQEETGTGGEIDNSFSVCLTNGKTSQGEMKTAKWSKKNYSDIAKHDGPQDNNAVKGDSKDVSIEKYETELNSSKYNLHKIVIPGDCADQINICVEEEMPSSVHSAWSQLDLSGVEITQLEKVSSCYSGSPNINAKENSEDHIPSTAKECAHTSTLESCILNTSSLINVHKLLNDNSPEKPADSKNPSVPTEMMDSPTLAKDCETKRAPVISDSENTSYLMENTTFTEFLEANSSCHHKYSKENSKISSGSPGDNIVTAGAYNGKGLKQSGLAVMNSLSSFKRRPKKFVYSLKDTSGYQKEGTTQADESYLVQSGTNLKSSNTEVFGTTIRNEGKTEEPSDGNKYVEEDQKVEFEKSWAWNNTTNKIPTVGLDQFPVLKTDRRNDTNLLSHQGKESRENKTHTNSSNYILEKENSEKCAHLTNCTSFQEGGSEDSELSVQALKRGNRQTPLGLVAQYSSTQMVELDHLKMSKPNVDKPNLVKLEKSLDLRQPLLDIDKQIPLGQANHSKNQSLASFKTSSNKQIALSEDNIRKSKLIFKDIEEAFLKDSPCEQMQYIPNQNVQENAEISAVRINTLNKSISNFSQVSDSQMGLIELSDAKILFPEFCLNQQSEGKQILTASEQAEVAELSNILEETGSQFEFTQLRKQRAVLQNSAYKDKHEITKLDLNPDAWKDNLKESCKPEPQRDSDQSLHTYRDTTEESLTQKRTNEEFVSVNLSSRKQNRECSVSNAFSSLHCRLSDLMECTSAGRKVSAISSEIFNKPADLASDVDRVDEMHSLHTTNLRNDCSSICDPSWNNPKYMKEKGIDWHQMVKAVSAEYRMKNNARDTVNFVKENMEKMSNGTSNNENSIIHISSTTEVNLKIVQKYSIRMTGNDQSAIENNHNILISHHFINCEETNCNDLQETVSDLTCLAEVAKTEQNSILNNVDEKENLNSNQQEKKIHSSEGGHLVPTTTDQNIFVPQTRKNKVLHVLAGCCVGEELYDMSSTSCDKTDAGDKKEAITSVKKTIDLNQNENSKNNSTMEFCTAGGKLIAISDKSLAKARYIFSDDVIFSEEDGHLSNFVSPSIQHSVKEKEENISEIRRELGGRIEKYNVLNIKSGSDDPIDLPDNITVKHTENPETVKKLSLEINTSKRRKKYDIKEGFVTENNPAYLLNTSDVLKSLFRYSDNDQCLHVEEGSDVHAKQEIQQPLFKNPNNVLINNNKNWDLSLSKTSSPVLKSECSALHHSLDNNDTNFSAENLICMSQTSPEIFNAEKFRTFEDIPNNVDFRAQKCNLNLSDTNSLLKDSSCEVSISASKLSTIRPVAFSTASGKAVGISQEAFKKARQLLHTDCFESTKQNTEFQSKTSKQGILENCSNALGTSEKLVAENSVTAQCSGAGKCGWEDKQALPMTLDAGPQSGCQTSCFQMTDKLSDPWASSKQNHIKSEFTRDTGTCEFFSTASGKPVHLTGESLKKARLLFSDIEENNHPVHPRHASDDSYSEVFSVGNKMIRGKCKLSPEERLPNTEVNSRIFCGFNTASGKQVHVSEKALQKVTGFFKEIDDTSSNNCFEDGVNLRQDHKSHRETSCAEAKAADEVISKPKLQEKCSVLYLTASNSNEKSKIVNAKIPLSESHIEKYKEPVQWGKSFPYTKQMGPLESQQPCPNRVDKTNATRHNTITEGYLDSYPLYSQTPENDFETEASESAKAFVEDEFTDSEIQKNKRTSIFVPVKTNNLLSNARIGKRRIDEENKFGEPPIKRKLLPEFDRSEGPNKSSLKASRTTPEDTMNDRRKFKYNIDLKPVISVPFSSSKERQEVLHPNLTTPDQDLKGSKSKSNASQQDISTPSLRRPSASWTPFSNSLAKESKKTESDYLGRKPVKVFVPPFKTKSRVSEDEIANSKKYDLLGNRNINRKEKVNPTKIQEGTTEPENNSFEDCSATQISLEYSEFTDTNSDLAKMVTDLQYARNLQEMRIIKKKRQRIRPQPGNLYLVKTSGACRIPLKDAVGKKLPGSYFSRQLYMFGVSKQCIKINSTNAEDFQFLIQDFFSKEYFIEKDGIQLADGGYLVPTDEGKAGKEEFYRALCDTPGVDPKLISKAWVYNHYKWIIWKLASMEVAFPQDFANKCLTPERVLFQLKYRYDMEVDKSHRSAIKRITERDDVACKTLILCISKIISLSADLSHVSDKNTSVENKREVAVIEVTDGWYGIRAVLDSALQSLLCRERLCVGQKIIVHGAELVGSQDACTPLEAPESLMLKISANSTRRARWYAKLGYHRDPRPFCLSLSSLLSDGGAVGCVDVIIQRVYPTQWMEKLSTGSFVFRNERAEEREDAKHKENQQKNMQALFAKIQAKFEMKEDEGKRSLRSRMLTRQQIRSLQDGAELYEAILNAPDPAYMEGYFSEEQLKALNSHRQMVNDKKQAQIEAEFRKAVESAEEGEHSCCRRDVTTVMRLRIVDYKEKGKEVLLNIWRPSSDVRALPKEGCRFRIFQLVASQSKGKLETANIQLTATKKTQYLQLQVSQEILENIYKPRECLSFSKILEPYFQPSCSEVDLVGYVVSLRNRTGSSVLYLSDESHNLIAVQICTDFKLLAVEDIIVPSKLISASNLKWQPKFRSDIPTFFAGDLTVFSSNPKERHLQGKFNKLKNTVERPDFPFFIKIPIQPVQRILNLDNQNNSYFGKDAQQKLMNLLQAADPQTFNLPKECGLNTYPSPWKISARNTHSIEFPTSELGHQAPLTVGKPHSTPPVLLDSEKMSQELQETYKNLKKRKAMDLLSQVPSPPPVNPISTFVSPFLRKAFQPPRSCNSQHARSLERTACRPVKKPSLKRLNETHFSLGNNFVADEELAMINTQALLKSFPKE